MRDLICEQIRNSKTWQGCIDQGLFDEENPPPALESLDNEALLEAYDKYLFGY